MTWETPSPRQRVGAVPGVQSMLVAIGITTILVVAGIVILVVVDPWPGDLAMRGTRGGGSGVVAITSGAGQASGFASASARALTTADADAIVRTVPGVTLISRVVFGTAVVGSGGGPTSIGVQAVDPSYVLNPQVKLAGGAFFTADDAAAANRVVVLGARVASGLFAGAQSPIGQTIRIAGLPFTVVGVLGGQPSGTTDPSDGAVLIPFQTGQVRLFGATGLGEVLLQVRDASQTDLVVQQVQHVLRTRHHTRSGQADGFTITAPSSSAAAASGHGVQFVERLQYLSQQFACQAKTLCG
ncbi:MAG: ABC transporter permease [Chloroflexota bacterium]|nr:ABC transporter permease [Chloroflexota bacterium]